MIKVLKFGGSSVTTEESRLTVAKIIKETTTKAVIIVSAMGRYPNPYATDTLKSLVSNRVSTQELERLLSVGETMSAVILADTLLRQGVKAVSLSSNQAGLLVKDKHLVKLNKDMILKELETYDVVVLPGFQGTDIMGEVEILERGDSDYSAVFVARALGLTEVSIYSDVPGIFTADPKIVKTAKLIPHVSYHQALDLAAHKARIICKKALEEGNKEPGFTIYLRSTYHNEGQTKINHDTSAIKTMSIAFNYWNVSFKEVLNKEDQKRIFEKGTGDSVIIEDDQIEHLMTKFTKNKELVKVHFVGTTLNENRCDVEELPNVIKSKVETNSYYVDAINYEENVTTLHDLIINN